MIRTCPLVSSPHGCQLPSPMWEGHVTFISLLTVLPAPDVVVLGKDRAGEGEGKG